MAAMVGVTHDSTSVVPILVDDDPPTRDFAYVESFNPACSGEWERAVRNDSYKLIQVCPAATSGSRCFVDADNCTEELYATDDVLECCDLWSEPNDPVNNPIHEAILALRGEIPDDVLCTTREGDTCMGCCAIDPYYGLTVDWDLPSPEPERWIDSEAYNEAIGATCQSHVVLKTTNKDTEQVTRYDVGRADNDEPMSLGAVTTAWAGPADNIRVLVGDAAFPLANVSRVEILAQSEDHYSGASLDLSGNLLDTVSVVESSFDQGGRVHGQINGTAKNVKAYAIGQDAASSGTLQLGGLESTSVVELVSHPVESALVFTADVPTGAEVKVTDASGFLGDVTSTEWVFNGRLCGANLVADSSETIPANIDVIFGTSAEVCDIDNDGDCTDCVAPCLATISRPGPEAVVFAKNRFISFTLSAEDKGDFAIRVTLDDLPETTTPPGFSDVSAFEGKVRYVNSFPGGVVTCVDSTTFGTSYKCAMLGCDPEEREWDVEIGNAPLHVTGSAVMPSATYSVRSWREPESGYKCRSPSQAILSASAYGDVSGSGGGPPDNATNIIDIGVVVDKIKDGETALSEPRTWLKMASPTPNIDPVNVIDVGHVVDALKGLAYPFVPVVCPGDAQ